MINGFGIEWVWAASELRTPISLSDPTIRLETEMMTEGEACYYLDSSSASSGAMEFLCGVEVSNSSAVEVLNSSAAKDLDDESR